MSVYSGNLRDTNTDKGIDSLYKYSPQFRRRGLPPPTRGQIMEPILYSDVYEDEAFEYVRVTVPFKTAFQYLRARPMTAAERFALNIQFTEEWEQFMTSNPELNILFFRRPKPPGRRRTNGSGSGTAATMATTTMEALNNDGGSTAGAAAPSTSDRSRAVSYGSQSY